MAGYTGRYGLSSCQPELVSLSGLFEGSSVVGGALIKGPTFFPRNPFVLSSRILPWQRSGGPLSGTGSLCRPLCFDLDRFLCATDFHGGIAGIRTSQLPGYLITLRA